MKLFDSHCHPHMSQFDEDRDAVLLRMQEKSMRGIVIGTDYETSKAALALAHKHDFLWAAVGLHPNDNLREAFDTEKYRELADTPKVVAIGECGLDYYRSGKTGVEREAQFQRFEAQLQLALSLDKALVIHCRDAHEDMLTILSAHRRDHGEKLRIIMHFFTGTRELVRRYLDLGCYISFPGPITYTDMYDESIVATPTDKIICETDAPFAAPVPFRGRRNEPMYVEYVVAKIAKLKGIPVEEMAAMIEKNSETAFRV